MPNPARPALTALALVALACGGERVPQGNPDLETKTEQKVPLARTATYFGRGVNESADLPLELGEGTLSSLVYAEPNGAATGDAPFFVSRVTGPDGAAIFDATRAATPDDLSLVGPPLRPSVLPGAASLVLPQTEKAFAAGQYTFRVAGPHASARVTTVRRTGTSFAGGVLDMNLFFVESAGIVAADRAKWGPAVDEFYEVLAAAGIRRGAVDAFDLRGAEERRMTMVDAGDLGAQSELRRLVAMSSRAPNVRAVNVFFVRSIDIGDVPGVLLGIALGIPAAITLPGTGGSGVVVSLSGHSNGGGSYDGQELGRTMAHEAGHAMGLCHTSEADARAHDLIGDTAECPPSKDVDGDGYVAPDECRSAGADNLMFWTSQEAAVVSPGQAAVLRRSPLVRPR